MPMKLVNIPKFEKMNPGLSITVLGYNNMPQVGEDGEIFKNPYIEVLQRSKVEDAINIHVLLLENGNLLHIIYYF